MIIYKTTNLINGKIYVGQNSNNNPNYIGSGLLLQLAIKKYGKNNFKKEILEFCSTKEILNEREKYWINYLNSQNINIGYNLHEGGTGGKLVEINYKKGKTHEEVFGIKKAKELRDNLSLIKKGIKKIFVNITSEEVGEKISNSLKGKIIKEESRNKISETLIEYFKTEKGIEQKENLRNKKKGKNNSEESKLKCSKSMKGRRPKIMDVHPSSCYWYFYDKNNNLIIETIGNYNETLKKLNTNFRRIIKFSNLEDCLNFNLEENKHYKVFYKKYY